MFRHEKLQGKNLHSSPETVSSPISTSMQSNQSLLGRTLSSQSDTAFGQAPAMESSAFDSMSGQTLSPMSAGTAAPAAAAGPIQAKKGGDSGPSSKDIRKNMNSMMEDDDGRSLLVEEMIGYQLGHTAADNGKALGMQASALPTFNKAEDTAFSGLLSDLHNPKKDSYELKKLRQAMTNKQTDTLMSVTDSMTSTTPDFQDLVALESMTEDMPNFNISSAHENVRAAHPDWVSNKKEIEAHTALYKHGRSKYQPMRRSAVRNQDAIKAMVRAFNGSSRSWLKKKQ